MRGHVAYVTDRRRRTQPKRQMDRPGGFRQDRTRYYAEMACADPSNPVNCGKQDLVVCVPKVCSAILDATR